MLDRDRILRLQTGLDRARLDAVVCALPAYVLMASGYWPVIGTSIAIVTSQGRSLVLAPKDEEELACRGWAEVRTYEPSSLDRITSVAEAVLGPLREALCELDVASARIGYEHGPASEPASYAGMHLFGAAIRDLLLRAAPEAFFEPADEILAALAASKTPAEVGYVRTACAIAERAFVRGASWLAVDMKETEAATYFRAPLSVAGIDDGIMGRADGFAFCMSGPNSAEAGGAYARSRLRKLQAGDLVLVHCNSYADGWWTDITRTYSLGAPDDAAHRMYEAVFHARDAALKTIRPGVRACDVDCAARDQIAARGFADAFPHSTGHGVGFAAISANARPRIHPRSEEVLEPGMVFNVEPAIYVKGFGGVRHCDMVAVTDSGVEVLTPFQSNLADLVIHGARIERPQAA